MFIRRRASAAVVVLAGLLVAACGGGIPVSTNPTPTLSQPTAAISTPAPTLTPTPAPTPTPTTAATTSPPPTPTVVTALGDSDEHVYPGTYTTHFRPALTLTVGSEVELSCVPGFKCRGDVFVNLPGWLNIGFGDDPGYELHLFRIDKVVDARHGAKLIAPPRDLAGWISKLPGVTVVSPRQHVKVGGLDAEQIDIQSGDAAISSGPIPGVKDPPGIGFAAHQAHRIVVVNVRGHQVLIMEGVVTKDPDAVVTAAELKEATDFLQPLVDSIVWDAGIK